MHGRWLTTGTGQSRPEDTNQAARDNPPPKQNALPLVSNYTLIFQRGGRHACIYLLCTYITTIPPPAQSGLDNVMSTFPTSGGARRLSGNQNLNLCCCCCCCWPWFVERPRVAHEARQYCTDITSNVWCRQPYDADRYRFGRICPLPKKQRKTTYFLMGRSNNHNSIFSRHHRALGRAPKNTCGKSLE